MASIHKEITVAATPEQAWSAIRDIGALHTRLAPGFVVDTQLEPGARIVTFGNGVVARELIVDLDDEARRLAWSIDGGRLSHHNGSTQVYEADEGRARIVWIADILPHDLRDAIDGMMEQGMAAMKKTLDGLGNARA